MARFSVWGATAGDWAFVFETDDEVEARERADTLLKHSNYLYAAVDDGETTIWSNDPDTPF